MRLLILATTKFAPTYNEKLISHINYFNIIIFIINVNFQVIFDFKYHDLLYFYL